VSAAQIALQFWNGDGAGVKDACGERPVHVARSKTSAKCSLVPAPPERRAARGRPCAPGQLLEVIAERTPSLAMQFSTISPRRDLVLPDQSSVCRRCFAIVRVTRVLVDDVVGPDGLAVDPTTTHWEPKRFASSSTSAGFARAGN